MKDGPYHGNFLPEKWFDGPKIEGYIKSIDISFEWRDQGYGYRKGYIWLKIIRAGETVFESSNYLLGTAPHSWMQVHTQLTGHYDIVRRFKPGDRYQFMRNIGGGGGHSLHVKNFKVLVEVVNYK